MTIAKARGRSCISLGGLWLLRHVVGKYQRCLQEGNEPRLLESSRFSKNILEIQEAAFDNTYPSSESSGGNQNEFQTYSRDGAGYFVSFRASLCAPCR